jgi:hypothetical protein
MYLEERGGEGESKALKWLLKPIVKALPEIRFLFLIGSLEFGR